MKILVTGGCGFIGSNFILKMLEKYPAYKIINLDKMTYASNFKNLKDAKKNRNYSFIKGDICNKKTANNACKKADLIVHFAAESHVDKSIENGRHFIETNILGTFNLLESSLKNNARFHHVSTDEVFGSLSLESKEKFSEKSPYCPSSVYSASKASSDHLVKAFFKTYGLNATISNCSNNYGPRQHAEKFIPKAITSIILGKKIPIYGDGKNIRDWLHVSDHVEALDLIIHKGKPGESYCIGGGCEKSNIEIAEMIIEKMGHEKNLVEFVNDRKGHDLRYSIDYSKIKKELGWNPKIKFNEGITETINWYKKNKDWWLNKK